MFSAQGPLIAIRVKLIPDPKTPSRLKWTSALGPDQTVTPGTLVGARIIVQQQPPITVLIPGLRKLFGR
jgi:HlyD family secretion protein